MNSLLQNNQSWLSIESSSISIFRHNLVLVNVQYCLRSRYNLISECIQFFSDPYHKIIQYRCAFSLVWSHHYKMFNHGWVFNPFWAPYYKVIQYRCAFNLYCSPYYKIVNRGWVFDSVWGPYFSINCHFNVLSRMPYACLTLAAGRG